MAYEIEHKYLVKDSGYRSMAKEAFEIRQGYLCKEPERTVRVRTCGEKGYITVKGITVGDRRHEYEYPIPFEDACEMLRMCIPPLIEKTRFLVDYDGFVWEVDEFHGNREGLVLAEIELPSSAQKYRIPSFVGQDVTGNPVYYNSNL